VCTPSYLAKESRSAANKYSSLKCSVLGEKEMKKLGMDCLLSVGAGSAQESKLITLNYQGGKKGEHPHVIVGKGITFDTGGISLKPGATMDEMKFDMCGAASVIGTMQVMAELKVPINIIGVVASAENREILLLSVLGVCFGYALLANVVGLSVAIGAFLAGVLVAESKSSEVSKILSSPIKDMFVAIFFVSVGALMDITQLSSYIFIAIALIAVTTAMKLGGNLLGNTIFKQPKEKALRVAFALSAPRGEFSIVIVKVGVDMGVVSAFLFPLIGLITIITAFMSPFLIKIGDKIIPKLSKS